MKRNSFFHLLLLLILALGLFIRVAHFPHIPPGLNQDEAASAYEAYALAETGLDKWGNPWPAYFPAWGSGQNVLLAYLTVPAIHLFGLNIFSARVVMLVLGALTLPLFYFGLRPLGRFPALLGTGLLAVVPWHFMLSRWGLESNAAPVCMLLGCVVLSRALITQQRRWIVPSLLPFALSLYAYGTTVVVLPLLWGIVCVLCYRRILPQLGSWLLALSLFAIVAAPFSLFFIENYVFGQNLSWTDCLFFTTPLLPSTRISQVADARWTFTLLHNWRFLISSFNDGTEYNQMPGFKPLLYPILPLALAGAGLGFHRLWQRNHSNSYSPRVIVLLVFGAWGAAAFSLFFAFELNINRFNHFFLPCLVLAVWAITAIGRAWQTDVARKAYYALVLGWLLVESSLGINRYFTTYPTSNIAPDFNDGLDDAFAALNMLPPTQQVRITEKLPLPYVYALFYLQYPPARFQREAVYSVVNGAYEVKRFGRYVFSDAELHQDQPYAYLIRSEQAHTSPSGRRKIFFKDRRWEVGLAYPAAQ